MTPQQFQRVAELYDAASQLEPAAREVFLDEACGEDGELRREVDSLLLAHDQADGYLCVPAMEVAAGLITHTPRSLVGRYLNQYQILSLLGAGGMGEVYLAHDTRLGRKVALKVLLPEFTRDADRLRRFEKEARAASSLNHPNLITIHEIGEVDADHYIVTEFVEGETLREQITKKRLEISFALDLATQMAGALAAAHAVGIIHRDIKPENVMVRPDGLVKVLDFGLAKLVESPESPEGVKAQAPEVSTEFGRVLGTRRYMSPEQSRGLKVDARSDIFSLGVVLYEMIAGRAPFSGATPTDETISIVQEAPAPLSRYAPKTPDDLERIVAKALRKTREERYEKASDLLEDLKRVRQRLELESLSGRTSNSTPALIRDLVTRRAWLLSIAAILIVVLTAGWLWMKKRWRAQLAQPDTPTIAVLPFKNLSPEKDSDYLADGLTDELIRNLSIIEGLEVRSRTSSFAFKNKTSTLREVGEQLKVNWVLDGSVQVSGKNLRINAQFVRVSDDKPVWTRRFDKELKDIFAIQDDISWAIVNELRVNLGRGRRRYENSIEAYDLYLRAGDQTGNRARSIPEFDEKISLCEQATAKDPSFAPAYARLALFHAWLSAQFVVDDTDNSVVKSQIAAEKAIQLDPLLEEAHIALGWVRARKGEWVPSKNSFREAIRLNPNSSEAYRIYADWMLAPIGRVDDALEQLRRAERADPLSKVVKASLGIVLISAGRYDEAAAYLEQSRDDTGTSGNANIPLARVWLGQGRTADAIQLLENRPELPNHPVLRGWLGNAYARSGRREEAEKMAAASTYANEQALIFAGLGDKDRTFEALERVGSRGPQRVGRYLTYPEFAFLRGDPRLAALRKKVGLPE